MGIAARAGKAANVGEASDAVFFQQRDELVQLARGMPDRVDALRHRSAMNYYAEHAQQLKRDLAQEIPAEELRILHQKRPLLHAIVAMANVAALIGSGVAIVMLDRWYFWLPFAVIAGFAVFDFTVLLHEVVHRAVLTVSDDRTYRI